MAELDNMDRSILRLLVRDAAMPLAQLAKQVGLSATPCWKRIRRMEESGVITGRVVKLDPARIGVPVSVFVSVETADHSA
ncbi:MAG TPA: Lrp/AsnC family transcriptional regulator, partial [Acetobacteraceae bacterium]|nr:Lrp/AsnC family transcriptional regulator [Acetobacteraceae bacterium]